MQTRSINSALQQPSEILEELCRVAYEEEELLKIEAINCEPSEIHLESYWEKKALLFVLFPLITMGDNLNGLVPWTSMGRNFPTTSVKSIASVWNA